MPRVIITVPEKNAQPYRFQLDREVVTIGRASENDIAIDSGSVSVKHAEMRRVAGGYILRDLGSTNGITLDGERYGEASLHHGISLLLGDVAFDFTLTDEERDALAQEARNGAPPVLWEPEKNTSRLPPLRGEEPARFDVMPEPELEEEETQGGGTRLILLIILLALAAFGVGMAIRFQKDTGGPLIEAIKAKHQPQNAPAQAVPAATSPDQPQQ